MDMGEENTGCAIVTLFVILALMYVATDAAARDLRTRVEHLEHAVSTLEAAP